MIQYPPNPCLRCAPAPPPRSTPLRRSRRQLIALVLLGVLALASCDRLRSTLEVDPDDVPTSEIIDLSRAGGGDLRADGAATEALTARLPANATTHIVTFTTTAGAFVESGGGEVKVRAFPDEAAGKLLARTVLRAPRDTVARTAVVRATIGDFYYDTVSVRFVP